MPCDELPLCHGTYFTRRYLNLQLSEDNIMGYTVDT